MLVAFTSHIPDSPHRHGAGSMQRSKPRNGAAVVRK